MSLWLKDPNSPPDEGFQYPAISGPNIKTFAWAQLHAKVAQHYAANQHPVPPQEDVIKWVCDNQQVSCYEGREPYPNKFTNPPSYAQRGLKSPNWPLLLMPFKLLAKPEDRGLGDIVERAVGKIGGDEYKAWHMKFFGKPCSCTERQDNLNRDFPL
jgi:hypothetical protein